MRYLKHFENHSQGETDLNIDTKDLPLPRKISHQTYLDMEITEKDEYGELVKNSPIPPSFYREIVKITGAEKYLPTKEGGIIQMLGRKPNTKFLQIIFFQPDKENPLEDYYLLFFTEDNTLTGPQQMEQGLTKHYMAEEFDEVLNFCRVYL
jgi:hypothetical protein